MCSPTLLGNETVFSAREVGSSIANERDVTIEHTITSVNLLSQRTAGELDWE